MKIERGRVLWGMILIVGGGFLLAYYRGLFGEPTETQWAISLSVLSLVFLVGYLLSGLEKWALLFPAAITAAGAAYFWLTKSGAGDWFIDPVLLGIISVPCWVGVLVSRGRDRWALTGAWVLAAVGVVLLLEDLVSDELFAGLILGIVAVPYLVVYVLNRRARWALMPFLLLALAGVAVYSSLTWRSEYFAVLVLFGFALPFYAIFLARRESRWALIPAWLLTALAVAVLLSTVLPRLYVSVFVAIAILGLWLLDRAGRLHPRG